MNHHFVMSIVLEQENFVFDGTSSNDQIHCPDGQTLSPYSKSKFIGLPPNR
jgi:hypothetical protein